MAKKNIVIEAPMANIPIQGSASPVDTFVAPVKPSGRTAAGEILDAIKGLNPAIQSYLDLQEAQVKTNRELGAMAWLMGKSPDRPRSYKNLGWGYNQGYATADGEVRGIQISQEYEQALEAANYFIDDPNPKSAQRKRRQLLDSISQKWLQGTQNVDVLAGASQRMLKTTMDAEEEAYKRFHVASYTKTLNDVRTSLVTLMKEQRKNILSEIQKSATDPDYQPNYRDYREILSGYKRELEAAGVKSEHASMQVIDAYGEAVLAAARGNPSLARTMLGVLELDDKSGFNYMRYEKLTKEGNIVHPFRNKVNTVKEEVTKAITREDRLELQDLKQEWAVADISIRQKIRDKDPSWRDDLNAWKVRVAGRFDISENHFDSMWRSYSSTWRQDVVDDGALYSSLLEQADTKRLSMSTLYDLNQQGLLSEKSAKFLEQQSNQRATERSGLAAQERAAAGALRSAAAAEESNIRKDRDEAWGAYQANVVSSPQIQTKLIRRTKIRDDWKAVYEASYMSARRSGHDAETAQRVAGAKAQKYLEGVKIIKPADQPAPAGFTKEQETILLDINPEETPDGK